MELFEHYIKTDGITFKHARGKSVMTGKEFHIYHEIILFLNGKAELITEYSHTPILPDTLLIIPKETYHQLKIIGNQEDYHRCILNFTDAPIKELSLHKADSEIKYLFSKLINNTQSNDKERILNSVLILLLNKLSTEKQNDTAIISQNPIILHCIDYINNNLKSKLSIEELSNVCNTSVSGLSHLFKKEMNISLHKYIIEKRLIAAYRKIRLGETATTVYLECGFNDYSGFYRQYKKMFGFPPSHNERSLSND